MEIANGCRAEASIEALSRTACSSTMQGVLLRVSVLSGCAVAKAFEGLVSSVVGCAHPGTLTSTAYKMGSGIAE